MQWRGMGLLLSLVAVVASMIRAEEVGACDARHADAVCIVVRTYWGHGERYGGDLRQLLLSLERQHHTVWEAIIVVMDSVPLPDLASIVHSLGDDRVWVYADWVAARFQPKSEGAWSPLYHKLLYELTDDAIRACSPDTRWVLVTNGDNVYAASALTEVVTAKQADLVAFDFYSRYQRITGPPCDRFSQQPGLPSCKRNLLRWCHTDLGANVMNWRRLIAEDHRFGQLAGAEQVGAEHFDGLMAEALVNAGWTVHHPESCLFMHNPSPQNCVQQGGVWDDTLELALSSPGGDCLTPGRAERRAAEAGIEEVIVQVSHDHHLALFQAPGALQQTQIRCLKDVDTSAARAWSQGYFGAVCASKFDM